MSAAVAPRHVLNPAWHLRQSPLDPILGWHGTLSDLLPSIKLQGLVPWRRTKRPGMLFSEIAAGEGFKPATVPNYVKKYFVERLMQTRGLVYLTGEPAYAYQNALASLEAEGALRLQLRELKSALSAGFTVEEHGEMPVGQRRYARLPGPFDDDPDFLTFARAVYGDHWRRSAMYAEILYRRAAHVVLTVWEVPIHLLGRPIDRPWTGSESRRAVESYRRYWHGTRPMPRVPESQFGTFTVAYRVPRKYLRAVLHLARPMGGFEDDSRAWRERVVEVEGDATVLEEV